MTEVLFYDLRYETVDCILPSLLEKTIARGWNAVVQVDHDERIEFLNRLLWTYRDDSFLPHGSAKDGNAINQPIYLTSNLNENPNNACIRFLIDGAQLETFKGYNRIVCMFNGNIDEALHAARISWKKALHENCDLTYWRQSTEGKWERKA
ncbi:MAG: hypothetical protein TECD_00786 [Hyphomicrobiaceae bacterium hypho_1]